MQVVGFGDVREDVLADVVRECERQLVCSEVHGQGEALRVQICFTQHMSEITEQPQEQTHQVVRQGAAS